MTRRVVLNSRGDEWTFEEGREAFYEDAKGNRHRAGFKVKSIGSGSPLLIVTDLTGTSRHGWQPIIQWGGFAEPTEV